MDNWSIVLLVFVGIGVGFASVLGVMKYAYGWSMKTLIYCSVIPNLALTCIVAFGVPELKGIADLAWDCAAVTTGPVTVPIVLALGVGVATVHSNDPSAKSQGFGIVTLASLYPVMCVEILGFISMSYTNNNIITHHDSDHEDITEETPYHELINGVRAIVPLIVFLLVLMKLVLKADLYQVLLNAGREKEMSGAIELGDMGDFGIGHERSPPESVVEHRPRWKVYGMWIGGLVAATLGVILFNFGITYGLAELGKQAGAVLPGAFIKLDTMPGSPEYAYGVGIFVMLFFSWVLGYLVTQAEPALHVMGDQVQEIGLMRKRTLVFAVSAGVGTGLALGVVLVIYKVTLAYVIVGGYALALIMTHFSADFLVNVAWDAAAVTTGDVTVPFVLVLGVSLADAVGGIGGFGILTMGSLLPIIAVLFCGFLTRFMAYWKARGKVEENSGDNEIHQSMEIEEHRHVHYISDIHESDDHENSEKREKRHSYDQYEKRENRENRDSYDQYESHENRNVYDQYENRENRENRNNFEHHERRNSYDQYEKREKRNSFELHAKRNSYDTYDKRNTYDQFENTENHETYGNTENLENPLRAKNFAKNNFDDHEESHEESHEEETPERNENYRNHDNEDNQYGIL